MFWESLWCLKVFASVFQPHRAAQRLSLCGLHHQLHIQPWLYSRLHARVLLVWSSIEVPEICGPWGSCSSRIGLLNLKFGVGTRKTMQNQETFQSDTTIDDDYSHYHPYYFFDSLFANYCLLLLFVFIHILSFIMIIADDNCWWFP